MWLSPGGRTESTGGETSEDGGIGHKAMAEDASSQPFTCSRSAHRGFLNRFCIFLININRSDWPNEDERAFKVGIIAPVWAIKYLRIALCHGKILPMGGSVGEDGGS